jgi:hypothetical protein
VSGLHQGGVGCTGGSETDVYTGLEARFNAQVCHAALGMSREEANGYVLEFLNHYETSLADPNRGKPFRELYDVELVEPNESWLNQYEEVSAEITTMGLDMDRGWKRALETSIN